VLIHIFEFLETDALLHCRLVKLLWCELASEILGTRHGPISFITTMDVNYFVYLMRQSSLQFMTKFRFNLRQIKTDAIQKFSDEHGHFVTDYELSSGIETHPSRGVDWFVHALSLVQKTGILLQGSPNIRTLQIEDEMMLKAVPMGKTANQLPTFPNLWKVGFRHTYVDDLIFAVVRRAPNLRKLVIPANATQCNESFTYFAKLVQILSPKTEIDVALSFSPPINDAVQISTFQKLSALNKKFTRVIIREEYSLTVPNPSNISRMEALHGAITNFLESLSESLLNLDVRLKSAMSLPILKVLESLHVGPTEMLPPSAFTPTSLPRVKHLTLSGNAPYTSLIRSVWPNIKTLIVRSLSPDIYNSLHHHVSEALPNLCNLELETYTLKTDLTCCLQHFAQLTELCLSFNELEVLVMNGYDAWDEITGEAAHVQESLLLAEEFVSIGQSVTDPGWRTMISKFEIF